MNQKSAFYLKLLVNRHHKGSVEPLLKFLSPDQESVLRQGTEEKELDHAFRHPGEFLSQIHYSWIAETIKTLPVDKQPLYISSLPVATQLQVKDLLGITKELAHLKGPLKRYIQKDLAKKIIPQEHTPLAYLPPPTLQPLLTISKRRMIEIINFLALFDLAEEMKKIVDTKLLKNIYLVLSKKQQEFLRSCLHHKDKLHSPKFPLNDWSGDKAELEQRLHKRGLLRFAKALSGQDPSFIWHITRSLDTGRGKRIESLLSKNEIPQVSQVMRAQVLQLINFLEKG